jgi:uncharacterized protein YjbI with pentapeptide repeats
LTTPNCSIKEFKVNLTGCRGDELFLSTGAESHGSVDQRGGQKLKVTNENLQRTVELHRMFLAGEQGGEPANLAGIDLYGVNLTNANLRGVNLEGASLRRALLWATDLKSANLKETNLKHAILEEADLREALLTNASLKGANLEHSDLRGANLSNADLENASLVGAFYDEKTSWPENFHPSTSGCVLVSIEEGTNLPHEPAIC